MTISPNKSSVSVVVPSYNHAQFIGSCLRSIIKQSLPPLELIVIDDGSVDGSPQMIEEILKTCPFRSELIARENRGLCATLNQGLALTKGDYFAYLASDDIWLPQFLAARVELLSRRQNAVLAYGHAYLIDAQNNIVDSSADWADYTDGDARSMLLRTTAPMSPTVVYRREALVQCGWNEATKLEDFELYLKLCLKGEFAFDARVLSAWRWHDANTSWNQQLMLNEHLKALEELAPQLGLGLDELEQLKRQISFRRAEDFLRVGDKRTASKLVVQNFDPSSPAMLARLAARMLLPRQVVEARRQKRQGQNRKRFGKIEI